MKNDIPITGEATDVTAETAANEVTLLLQHVALVKEAADAAIDWPSPRLFVGNQRPEEVAIQARLNQLAITAHGLAVDALEAFSRFLLSRARDRTGRLEKRLAVAERDGETHFTEESVARVYSNFNGRELGHAQSSAMAAAALLKHLREGAIAVRRGGSAAGESEGA